MTEKFFYVDSEEKLFEISNRTLMVVGEMFTDHNVTELIRQTIQDENLPENVIVLVSGEYHLQ